MIRQAEPSLHVVCYYEAEDRVYVFQCLEHDIAADGPTVEEARQAFINAFIGHHVMCRQFDQPPLTSMPQAPEEVWRRWREAGEAERQVLQIPPFSIHRRADSSDTVPAARELTVTMAI